MKYLKSILCLLCFAILPASFAQVIPAPVGSVADVPLGVGNSFVLLAEEVMNFLLKKEQPFQESIKDVQEFFQKAETVVNKSIKNMRMVRQIVDTQGDIIGIYKRALTKLNEPIDEDGDGVNDLEFLQKWKHLEVLLGLSREAASVFELFTNVIEADALTMNDKGRIILIEKTYKDMLLIKRAMRAHLRRVNREIYTYRRQRRQLKTYSTFFEIN